MTRRVLALSAFTAAFLTAPLHSQELLPSHAIGASTLAQYRTFELKSGVAAVAATTGLSSSEAKTTHERPALLQELEWRPSRWLPGSSATSTDPVEQIVFSFYNDQLFRIVVDYARDRTEGLSNADITDALAAVYGTPGKAAVPARAASQIEVESGAAVATWRDAANTVVLYRTAMYGAGFRLIVTDSDLDRLARKAEVQAARLDEQQAPGREIARLKKERDDGRAVAEKARVVNKKLFRP